MPQTHQVTITSFKFKPTPLTIAAGDTVTWTNQDTSPHTVTADDGSFDSGEFGKGETFSWTFETPGTTPYHCEVHPSMTGSVTAN